MCVLRQINVLSIYLSTIHLKLDETYTWTFLKTCQLFCPSQASSATRRTCTCWPCPRRTPSSTSSSSFSWTRPLAGQSSAPRTMVCGVCRSKSVYLSAHQQTKLVYIYDIWANIKAWALGVCGSSVVFNISYFQAILTLKITHLLTSPIKINLSQIKFT